MVVGRPAKPLEVQRWFWQRVRAGDGIGVAARTVGVSPVTGERWFGHAGGVIPSFAVDPKGRRLVFADREEIAVLRAGGAGVRSIARELGWSASTISRELTRSPADRHRARGYRASVAQAHADRQGRRPKPAVLATNLVLRRQVVAWLSLNHSPEQIAARLRRDFPDDQEMRVSPETVYQSIYVQGRGALRRDLAQHLRTGRAVRRPHRRPGIRRPRLTGMVNISERPADIEDRAVPGHWNLNAVVKRRRGLVLGKGCGREASPR